LSGEVSIECVAFTWSKDEYTEHELEEALIHQLEDFLLELGGDVTFVGRQRRLRIGDEWYRIDLLFFHRKLRCLVVIDLLCGRPHNRSIAIKLRT
jgi:predicted nuclease of restriction endonuclease-like (RecB) superfamily